MGRMQPNHDASFAKPPPDFLDEDMRPSEIVEVLEALCFRADGHCLVELDRGIRDFLLRAIKPRNAQY